MDIVGMLFMVALLPFIGIILGVVGFARSSRNDNEIRKLKREVARLTEAAASVIPSETDVATVASEPVPEVSAPAATATVSNAITPDAEVEAMPDSEPEMPLAASLSGAGVEQALASRWFVWIGGAAVALGSLLFIKYAHDHALISPVLRIFVGLLLAAVLVAAGEYVRRGRAGSNMDYVPAALSAAGLVTAFGSIYTAYALYGLVPSLVAFLGLAGVALGAFALSRVQGPMIAALGLIGSYVAPALVTSEHPSAWSFFPYLLVIVAASLFTQRGRSWVWLGFLAVLGATAWALLWVYGGAFEPGDETAIGLFAIALGLLATLVLDGRQVFSEASGNLLDASHMSWGLRLAVLGMVAGGTVLRAQVFETSHSFMALVFFALGMAAVAAFGWFKEGTSIAALAAAVATLFVLMGWQEVSTLQMAMDENGMWSLVPGLVVPPLFLRWMMLALLGFGGLGVVAFLRRETAQSWAMLAAGSAAAFSFGAWARAGFVLADASWALLGAGLSALLFGLAWLKRATLQENGGNFSIAALLIGFAVMGLFALDRLFDGVWYTLAIAIFAFGIAASSSLLPSRMIAKLAAVLGGLVALKLFVLRELWLDTSNLPWGHHWVIYAYGVPALLLFAGSRLLRNQADQNNRVALEGVSLGLIISLVSLELRVLISGGIVGHDITLLEMSAHILAWLGAAFGLAYRQALFSSLVSKWGARILLAGSCAALVGFNIFLLNPVFSEASVEGGAFINSLWLGYLAPVGLLALILPKLEGLGWAKLRYGFASLALVLLVGFVSLQTKRLFEGSVLQLWPYSDAESYALSAVWLVLAVGMFVGGLRFDRSSLRYGGLAVMLLALVKGFAYDLWELTGLWQIASVVGMGLCLIGVGWLYTRFVQQPKKQLAS